MRPEWALALFMFIGAIACFVWRRRRWLVFAELAIVGLYVGSAASKSHLVRLFTGMWYDDSHRIAATLPIVAIPLATAGVLATGELLRAVAYRAGAAARPAVPFTLSLIVGAAVVVAVAVQDIGGNESIVAGEFSASGPAYLVSQSKLQFLRTVAHLVPPSTLVANDPYQGTAYLFAMSGIPVLFPQISPPLGNKDMTYLAQNLVHLSQDPRACQLVRQYHVGYMVVAPTRFPFIARPDFYQDLADPGEGSGFQLVAADGPQKLYKITICQPGKAAGPVEAASRGGS
jgi:hypothetical protein